jgi:hypothetical protein
MATTVEGLFNLPTAQQAGQKYLEGMMSSPAQLNQLSLLQQAVAMGRDAGAGVGYTAGRLLGGKAPDEVRIEGVNQAMAEATQMGGTDAEMYANLAKGLAARGLTQDAMAATEKARAAKRDEQAMTLAASQEERAVLGEKRAVSAEQRALLEEQRRVIAAQQQEAEYKQRMKIYPLEIQEKDLAIREREKALNGPIGEVTLAQEALVKGIDPQTGEPLTAEGRRALTARLAQATMVINAEVDKLARERADHELKMKVYESKIAENNAQAASAKANLGMSKFTRVAKIQVPGFTPMDKPTSYEVGTMNGYGQVRGKDGILYNNVNEAARAQGIIGGDGAPTTTAVNPAAPAADKKAEPEEALLKSFVNQQPANNAGTPQVNNQQATSAAPVRSTDGGKTFTLDVPSEIRDPSVPYYRMIKNPAAGLANKKFNSRQEAQEAYMNATRK